MIYTYASDLNEKDLTIRESVHHFTSLYQYTSVNSFKTSDLSVREVINRSDEIILSDAPAMITIKFHRSRNRLEVIVDHTVLALDKVFSNENRLIRKVGDIIKQNNLKLASFDLGTDGVISL